MNRSKRIKYWASSKAAYWGLAIYQKDRVDPDAAASVKITDFSRILRNRIPHNLSI